MTRTGAYDYNRLASEAVGNWKKFECFAWHDKPEDAEQWTHVLTHHRDSGLRAVSNASAIAKLMGGFIGKGNVQVEHQGHFAYGWVDGYAIRVYSGRGRITRAFKVWCDIQERLSNYPVLDEEDLSRRETEATEANIKEVAERIARKHGDTTEIVLPENFVSQLWDALEDSATAGSEGGYPKDSQMEDAFLELGWLMDCSECGVGENHIHCPCHEGVMGGVLVHSKRVVNHQEIDLVDCSYSGVLHPISGVRFCSMACFVDGYSLEVQQ